MDILAAVDPAALDRFTKISVLYWLGLIAGIMYFVFPLVVWSYLGLLNKRLENIEDRLTFMTHGPKKDSPQPPTAKQEP